MSEAYPGRPGHPDFWHLSKIVIEMDEQAEDEAGFIEILESMGIDQHSLAYMSHQRALRARQLDTDQFMMAALWMDGFIAGYRYIPEGGE